MTEKRKPTPPSMKNIHEDLEIKEMRTLADLSDLWNRYDFLALPNQVSKKFITGLACSDRCVEKALQLRYQVFKVEMGHGPNAANGSELDRDEYDDQMTHLLLLDRAGKSVVGTYRLQTVPHALANNGVYSAQEYDISPMRRIFETSVECGRACIAPEFRKATSLFAMWSAMHVFMAMSGNTYLFGCCSVSSHEPRDGWRVMKTLREKDFFHPDILMKPTPAYDCGDPQQESAPDCGDPIPLPKLFHAYMRLGARVCSLPAIDRDFGTIDFLVLCDMYNINMSDWIFKR